MPGNREIGSGLGLSIVRRAAEILKGRFILQNEIGKPGLIAILQFPAQD
jgi:signal transduction histidine kinase